jgi:hypothetical protein
MATSSSIASNLTNAAGRLSLRPVQRPLVRAITTRSQQAAALRSKIMTEAHARAKADYADELACRGRAHHVDRPYSYFLGLQMRSGFAEARVARTGMAPAFELPPQRWA